jgi:hypothetical protein
VQPEKRIGELVSYFHAPVMANSVDALKSVSGSPWPRARRHAGRAIPRLLHRPDKYRALRGKNIAASDQRPARFLSTRTPLNFLAAFLLLAGFFTAMNSPDVLLRLVQALTTSSLVLT